MGVNLVVVVGGGGVGKTTVAAAAGQAMASLGARTLVITVDPARRLADTLGIVAGSGPVVVELAAQPFTIAMPDARQSIQRFSWWLLDGDEAAVERVGRNALFRELSDALVGMHEMMCLMEVEWALADGAFDTVVLDTAPSRHALEFLEYPERLVELLEGKTVRFLSLLAGTGVSGKGLRSWGQRVVVQLMQGVLGDSALVDIAQLFGELQVARARWLQSLVRLRSRLRDRETAYWVVSSPAGASLADGEHLWRQLPRDAKGERRLILNRATAETPDWWDTRPSDGDPLALAYWGAYAAEGRRRREATMRAHLQMRSWGGGREPFELPRLEGMGQREMLLALASRLGPTLTTR